jgi:hypothetical protein
MNLLKTIIYLKKKKSKNYEKIRKMLVNRKKLINSL